MSVDLKAIAAIDTRLWEDYRDPAAVAPEEHQALMWLESDIEDLIVNGDAPMDEVLRKIEGMPYGKEAIEAISLTKIEASIAIRSDWQSALSIVKKGRELSEAIGWGLSKNDISSLAKLHKARKFRKKIEDLLEDCNFHSVCGAFARNEYDEYITTKKEKKQ